jgi:hypothetical protein
LEAEVSRFAKTSPEKAFKAMEYNKSGQMYSIVGELKEICMSMVDGSIAQVSSLLTASRHGIMATVEPTSADA